MKSGQLSNEEAEKFRQEGREEVLDWLLQREIVNYSIPDNEYFMWDRYKSILTMLPWRRNQEK
jgi:hypothetical protein